MQTYGYYMDVIEEKQCTQKAFEQNNQDVCEIKQSMGKNY